jgi:hypothetical protein
MHGRPPAIPQDLNVEVIIYRRVVTGVSEDYGQKTYGYVKRRGARVSLRRQRSSNDILEHNLTSGYHEFLVGNWWDWMEVEPSDVILRCGDRVQFGLHGPPINWQGRNRWAIIELVSNGECLPGIDSANCPCKSDPASLVPVGTEPLHNPPAAPPADPPAEPPADPPVEPPAPEEP